MNDRKERQVRLRQQYFFECQCKACREDWPVVSVLRAASETWLCPNCHVVVVSKGQSKKCSKCKRELKVTKLAKFLANLEATSRETISSLTQENRGPVVEKFRQVILEMERHVKLPSWSFILAQQVLSHCYSLEGNTYVKAQHSM